jgi:hypothetical protein
MSEEPVKFTVKQAAHYLGPGCSASVLNKLRCSGGGPIYFQIRRRVIYFKTDLDNWIATGRRSRTPGADARLKPDGKPSDRR